MSHDTTGRVLTGRAVLLIALGAFAVTLAVNLLLAFTAVRTFSGLVVDNSYVASQHFNAARDAQLALGWTVTLTDDVDAGVLRLAFTNASGAIVRPAALSVTLGRPTTTRDDQTIVLEETVGGYAGAAPLAPGLWRVEIVATATDGTAFHQSRSLRVKSPS
ncbi:FixH family protein [Amaricoccus sp.]|uniref:FixH family protein n=1 Tax=Amaricoccus sp. TaxID=1872485 RepID=UPI00260F084A|nr:FixH family protein [uncultured Amaricoccus sp.]